MIKRLKEQCGYSLIEVMVSILILSIAIIPMVGMFDSGLKAASTSGNYDTARAFANKKLEQAKSLPYTQVRDNFPRNAATSNPTNGSTTGAITSAAAPDQVPNGFSYTVRKRHMKLLAGASASSTNVTPNASSDTTDTGLIEVTVTVSWSTNSYTTQGIISKETP